MSRTLAPALMMLFAMGYIIALGIGLDKWFAACAVGRCVVW